LNGRVTFSEVSGSETFLYVDTVAGALTAQVEGVHIHALGDSVSIDIPADRLFAFEIGGSCCLVGAPATGAQA